MARNKSGSIVNVSSIASFDGTPSQYEYAASKAAVNGAVRQLSRELWQYGIRVNAVAPGIIDTKMGDHISEDLKKEIDVYFVASKKNRGIAYTIALTSIVGVKMYKFLSQTVRG